jgi:hypothetical protein
MPMANFALAFYCYVLLIFKLEAPGWLEYVNLLAGGLCMWITVRYLNILVVFYRLFFLIK